MAIHTTDFVPAAHANMRARLQARIDAFFATLGQGMNAYIHSKSRMAEMEVLNAKTDAELAEMGLIRDDIPRYVFRDIFYV